MPNYFAHLIFGGKVLQSLPQPLAAQIREERAAFHLGCLGPDPLFFYRPALPNPYRREGMKMHAENAAPAFQRLALAIREGLPQAGSYAAGFLCHLALDSACHGYVDRRAAQGPISHMAMEGEYDRMLMELDGLNAGARAYLPRPADDEAVWEAAAQAFVHATAGQMRRAYYAMTFYSNVLARANGRLGGAIIGAFSRLLPIVSARGIALGDRPHPAAQESNACLGRLLERAVPETAEQIAGFFQAIQLKGPVPWWFDRDFKGNPPRQAEREAGKAVRAVV